MMQQPSTIKSTLAMICTTLIATRALCGGDLIFQDGFEFPPPYIHVWPTDLGNTFGVGAVAPAPTQEYIGPLELSEPTVIENVIINGCLKIRSSQILIRNVMLRCDGDYVVAFDQADVSDVTIEFSDIQALDTRKIFINLANNIADVTIRNNNIHGGDDWFYLNLEVHNWFIENNWLHDPLGDSLSHFDVLHLGEWSGENNAGTLTVRGNFISEISAGIGQNSILYTPEYAGTVRLENNRLPRLGHYSIRCHHTVSCLIRHNVLAQALADPLGQFGEVVYFVINSSSAATESFRCQRHEDGTLYEEFVDDGNGNSVDTLLGMQHDTVDCPPIP